MKTTKSKLHFGTNYILMLSTVVIDSLPGISVVLKIEVYRLQLTEKSIKRIWIDSKHNDIKLLS